MEQAVHAFVTFEEIPIPAERENGRDHSPDELTSEASESPTLPINIKSNGSSGCCSEESSQSQNGASRDASPTELDPGMETAEKSPKPDDNDGSTLSDGSILSKVKFFTSLSGKKEPLLPIAKPIFKPMARKEFNGKADGDHPDAHGRQRKTVPLAPLPQGFYSYRYFMGHPRRGMALVINNREFSMPNTPYRKGSDNDAVTLQRTLLGLGFKVDMYTDMSVQDMRNAVTYYATMDHSEADCFFFGLFSHGEDGIIYGADGKVSLQDLTAPFRGDKCTTLAGKPKIFVIQACRGDQLDGGVDLVESDDRAVYRIPAEADFLYAFSTPTGYFSWRNTELGSWFIQNLCRILDEHASDPEMDFLRLLTRVNYEVAMSSESNVPTDEKWHRKKQIPSITSMLTKDLFFTPKSSQK